MSTSFLLERFREFEEKPAIIWRDEEFTYGDLLRRISDWKVRLREQEINPLTVVGVTAEFSPDAVAALLALAEQGSIVVPLTPALKEQHEEFSAIAGIGVHLILDRDGGVEVERRQARRPHPLVESVWSLGHSGLIHFSSGSTGTSKAILHDFEKVLKKYETRRPPRKMICFLKFDHFGGINTALHILSSGGCMVTVPQRTPEVVCAVIEKHQVEVLPTTPTFLNLLMLSGAVERYDLSSIRAITYGTEPMTESLLECLHRRFPGVKLQQTYGLTEVGVLRSKSESSLSLWVKVGGEGFEVRVRNGLLEIKAETAMVGYLNAPVPLTEDGWFMTGDAVEVKGEYLKILGRKSELINVGGEKVYPAEVESVVRAMPGVKAVAVYGAKNALTGHMVAARVSLTTGESVGEFRRRVVDYCRGRLPRFKVPQKISLTGGALHGDRFKTLRLASATGFAKGVENGSVHEGIRVGS